MEAAKDNEVDYEASEWENDENPMVIASTALNLFNS